MAGKQKPYEKEELTMLKNIVKAHPDPGPGEVKQEIERFLKKFPDRTYAGAYYKLCALRDQEAGRPTSYQRAHQKTKKKKTDKNNGWGGYREKSKKVKKTEARHPVKGKKLMMNKNEISIPYTGLRIEDGHVVITF